MLLNWWPALRVERIRPLADAGEVYFDLAMLEGIEGVARLVEQVPPERILFGSNFPLFYFEAALLKVQESGLPEVRKTMLFEGNARRILPKAGLAARPCGAVGTHSCLPRRYSCQRMAEALTSLRQLTKSCGRSTSLVAVLSIG